MQAWIAVAGYDECREILFAFLEERKKRCNNPIHVLLRLDPHSVDARRGKRADGDYALAWTKTYGRGRVVYTALGHEPAVWADGRFQEHLLGAIRWALGGA